MNPLLRLPHVAENESLRKSGRALSASHGHLDWMYQERCAEVEGLTAALGIAKSEAEKHAAEVKRLAKEVQRLAMLRSMTLELIEVRDKSDEKQTREIVGLKKELDASTDALLEEREKKNEAWKRATTAEEQASKTRQDLADEVERLEHAIRLAIGQLMPDMEDGTILNQSLAEGRKTLMDAVKIPLPKPVEKPEFTRTDVCHCSHSRAAHLSPGFALKCYGLAGLHGPTGCDCKGFLFSHAPVVVDSETVQKVKEAIAEPALCECGHSAEDHTCTDPLDPSCWMGICECPAYTAIQTSVSATPTVARSTVSNPAMVIPAEDVKYVREALKEPEKTREQAATTTVRENPFTLGVLCEKCQAPLTDEDRNDRRTLCREHFAEVKKPAREGRVSEERRGRVSP